LREEATVAHNKMKEASDSVASSQRRDFQESRNLTQAFLEYVAKQPANMGPGTLSPRALSPGGSEVIGMHRAAAILNAGGADYEAYVEGFKKDHPTYDIKRINTSQLNQEIESQYQDQSNAFKADHQIESQYDKNKESLKQKGENLGLREETFQESGLKKEVADQRAQTNERLEARQKEHAQELTPLQEKVEAGRNQTVVGSNLKQIGWSAVSTVGLEKLFDSSKEIPKDKTPHNSPLNRK
jgi:flagellar biosynthesis/type III secretory pathway protein FliH